MSDRILTSWIMPLKGHAFDLEDLPLYLDGSPVTVVKRGDKYFIQLSTSVTGTVYERVGELAADFLALVNGAAILHIDGYRPIELEGGASYGLDENDKVMQTMMQVGNAELRSKADCVTVANDGIAQSDQRRGSMAWYLVEASRNQAKADALTLVGRCSPTWSELYVVYELVQSNVGRRMFTDNWIRESDGNLFTQTACSYTALGVASRHGKDRGRHPANPMQHQTAVVLMRSLVTAWLRASFAQNSS